MQAAKRLKSTTMSETYAENVCVKLLPFSSLVSVGRLGRYDGRRIHFLSKSVGCGFKFTMPALFLMSRC